LRFEDAGALKPQVEPRSGGAIIMVRAYNAAARLARRRAWFSNISRDELEPFERFR